MAFDISFLLGLDDSEFRRTLRNSESELSRSAGRYGSIIRSQTEGFQRFASSITSSFGAVTGILGTVTLVTGAVYGVYSLIRDWATASERAAEAAAQELERRRAIRETVEQALIASRVGAGVLSQDVARIESERKRFDELREKVAEETRYNDLLLERQSILTAIYQAEQRRERARAGQATELIFGSGPDLERLAEIEALLTEHEDRIAEISALEASVLEHIRAQVQARADALELQSEITLQTLAGNTAEAERLKELARHEEQLRKIQEIGLQDLARAERLRELEDDVHSNRLRQIEQEEELRRAADEAQEQRAREQAELDRQRAADLVRQGEILEEQQEIERLRLSGMTEAARLAELELEHRRNIESIQRREGIGEELRNRLLANEEQLFRLRLQDAEAQSTSGGSRFGGGVQTLGTGFADRLISRQVFGAGDSSEIGSRRRQVQATDENTKQLKALGVEVKKLREGGSPLVLT